MRYLKKFRMYESNQTIEDLCQKFGIENYTINSDGTISVNSGVMLMKTAGDTINFNDEDFSEKLPLKFKSVNGSFIIANNGLTTLEGCPEIVGDNFLCNANELESLVGGPKKVMGNYDCSFNKLESLDGVATWIGGKLMCNSNQIKIVTVQHLFQITEATFFFNPVDEVRKLFGDFTTFKRSLEWDYFREPNLIRLREFREACLDEGIEVPNSIEGYEYI